MDDFKPKNLKKVEDLFIITSTHGEGDPPDNAVELHEYIHGRKAPKLDGVRFSVLALGDQTYEFFCQTGKDFDNRLAELGQKDFIIVLIAMLIMKKTLKSGWPMLLIRLIQHQLVLKVNKLLANL